MLKKILNYSSIGLLNTILGYFLIFFLTYKEFNAELANLLGYSFGIFLSYILNKKFNFKSKNTHKKDFPKFLFSMIIAYILNFITLIILYRLLELNVYISHIFAGCVYLLSGFFLSNFFVFSSNKKDD